MYYNSHGEAMSVSEFIELEVRERDNYSLEEVNGWFKKYNVNINTARVIWVCLNKIKAFSYSLDSNEIDKFLENPHPPLSEIQVFEYTDEEGFIIPESNDGDDGLLFVFNDN